MYRRKKLGFTLVEIITVMVLISFVCIMTTKVIQHNLEQKVPLYVYNLYKNLENEGKILTNTLQTQEEYKNMPLEDILQSFNATNYCEAFAKDVNLIGNVDCENSVKNVQSGASNRKKVTYSCTRNYEFKVNDNGSYTETLNPTYNSTNDLCSDNTNFTDETITCNAQPTVSIANLMKSNTSSQQTYSCTKKSEEDDEPIQGQLGEVFDLDTKPGLNNELKTTNNIRLNFVALSNGQTQYTGEYDLSAYVNQDAICPTPNDVTFTITPSATLTEENISPFCISSDWGSANNFDGCYSNKGSKYIVALLQYDSSQQKVSFKCNTSYYNKQCTGCRAPWSDQTTKSTTCYCVRPGWKYEIPIESPKFNINFGSTCSNYIDATNISESEKTTTQNMTYQATTGGKVRKENWTVSLTKKINNIDYYKTYYTKWNTFFMNNSSFEKVTKAAIDLQGFNEGSVSTNSNGSQNYLAHFIYAAIDTPFDKGEMNKNIFVFEQFGDKIIPVGFLANNANSPLKFNVITRNPQTFKIEKVNNDALTFCEAMEYTGDKFSQYCGCKDGNNNVVTQFEKNAACNNSFGCKIKPIRPTNLAPKFKLF